MDAVEWFGGQNKEVCIIYTFYCQHVFFANFFLNVYLFLFRTNFIYSTKILCIMIINIAYKKIIFYIHFLYKVVKRSLDPGLPASKITTGSGLKNKKTDIKPNKTKPASSTDTESKSAETPSTQVEDKSDDSKKKFNGGLKGLKKVKAKGSLMFYMII